MAISRRRDSQVLPAGPLMAVVGNLATIVVSTVAYTAGLVGMAAAGAVAMVVGGGVVVVRSRRGRGGSGDGRAVRVRPVELVNGPARWLGLPQVRPRRAGPGRRVDRPSPPEPAGPARSGLARRQSGGPGLVPRTGQGQRGPDRAAVRRADRAAVRRAGPGQQVGRSGRWRSAVAQWWGQTEPDWPGPEAGPDWHEPEAEPDQAPDDRRQTRPQMGVIPRAVQVLTRWTRRTAPAETAADQTGPDQTGPDPDQTGPDPDQTGPDPDQTTTRQPEQEDTMNTPDDDSPAVSIEPDPSTYQPVSPGLAASIGSRHPMMEMLEAADLMVRVAQRWEPEGMLEAIDAYRLWPEVLQRIADAWKIIGDKAAEYPLHQTVRELIESIHPHQLLVVQAAEMIAPQAHRIHRDQIEQAQDPRNKMWDVQANQEWAR